MRRLILLIVLVGILLAGGALTTQLLSNSGGGILPVLQQTEIPDASPTTMLPWKAEQFFLLIGFILFNLIGIGVTLALIFWFLDRGVRRNRAQSTEAAQQNAAQLQVSDR